MASFNRVLLMGNLTRDVQTKTIGGGTTVAEFGLACNRKFKTGDGEQKEEVLFVDCTAFGKPAEIIEKYCAKGKPLFVEGRLKLDQWEDKKDGSKRSKISIVVENFQLLGGPEGGKSEGGDEPRAAGKSVAKPAKKNDDDIPF
ncbi:MAG: single-stranded DNA-binding protein [Bacillota bacterium]